MHNNTNYHGWNKALTFGVGSIQLSFRTIVFTQYMQRCFQSKCYCISVKLCRVCTLVLFIIMASLLSGVIRSLLCKPPAFSPAINNITCLYTQGAGPEHNTAKLYASARTRPLNSRPRALALAMYLHIFILRIWARRR